eukprot:NODE_2004_length_674_cov_1315.798400_g1566_i0.p1 GENE.NODE_2004_length_674_cov_1315.798400_g1566_i0~~NODE_2004_length_674_cov_1315.798400_g1566_i0.p1  ORF type:complete len:177 (-),score=67.97 NODE_2004_length_674_cov_1315.798400_g1566_i0:142-615(-)
MADEDTGEYHTAESGASATFPMQCGNIKKGGYVCIKGRPCKVVEYTTSKTGKHGHAKAHIIAIDIFTSKKLEELCPTTHNLDVPNVQRTEYPVVDIDHDGFVTMMDPNNEEKNDVKVPAGDVGARMQKDFDDGKELIVSVIKAMGEEAIVACKEAGN